MIILDTNVISEMLRPEPSATVLKRLKSFHSADRFTTAVSEAEIRFGLAILPHGRKRQDLQLTVDEILRRVFADRVLPFDSESAKVYAEIAAERRAAGRPISQSDAQIAAIARVRSATLVTRNTRDFEGCHVLLIDPWQAA